MPIPPALQNNAIGDAGAKSLAAALTRHPALASLNLSANSIGPEGATAIGHALAAPGCPLKASLLPGPARPLPASPPASQELVLAHAIMGH